VEVDGGQHYIRRLYDARRDSWLRAEGYTVLRFSDHEVLTQVDDVKQAIWKALEEAPSSILPRGGGEKD
jgi:very-short-patch-repair endonuclease